MMVLPGANQKRFVKGELASRGVAFLKNHLCSYEKLKKTCSCLYLWCKSAGKSRGVSVAGAQHELQIKSEHSIADWNIVGT